MRKPAFCIWENKDADQLLYVFSYKHLAQNKLHAELSLAREEAYNIET